MITTAVILAAGLGSRLGERTRETPKGLLHLGGRTLVERSIGKLSAAGIGRVVIGTGYLAEQYEEFAAGRPGVECCFNPRYAESGSMYTLANLRERVDSDFLLLESDLLYEARALAALLEDTRPNLVLASGRTGSGDEVYVEIGAQERLVAMSKDAARLRAVHGEMVGISKVSLQAYRLMCAFAADAPRLEYEYAMVGVAAQVGFAVRVIDDLVWCEIDDENHLARALTHVLPRLRREEGRENR